MKSYGFVSGLVFAVVAVVHLVRVLSHTEVSIGGMALPMSASVIGALAAGALSVWGFSTACCRREGTAKQP